MMHVLTGKVDSDGWEEAFSTRGMTRVLQFRVDQMSPKPNDIFTMKLGVTKSIVDSFSAGSVTPMRRNSNPSWQDVISCICIISTHNRIARTGDFRISSPGFWVRRDFETPVGDVLSRHIPVMPLAHLCSISGIPMEKLVFLLSLLQEDGVIRVFRNRDGVSGVSLMDGYVDDVKVRPFLSH